MAQALEIVLGDEAFVSRQGNASTVITHYPEIPRSLNPVVVATALDPDQHARLSTALSCAMSSAHEHKPGDPAPATGHYEELNVFESHTGKVVHVMEGELLAAAPRGFTWRRVMREDCWHATLLTPARQRNLTTTSPAGSALAGSLAHCPKIIPP